MEILSKNIGPAGGERSLGRADEPGVYFLVAPKASGKSTHGRLFAALRDAGALKAEASITDGEDEAWVEFTPRRVTFVKGPGGELREPSFSGEGEFPAITVLPAAIETLITGDHIKGEEARARRRLGALLAYAPISSTREIVGQLCEALEGRSFTEAEASLCTAWNQLAQQAKEGGRRAFRIEPLRSAESIKAMALSKERKGVLDDQDFLVELLNATANTGERAAAVQSHRLAAVEGKLEESFLGALKRLGWGEDRADELRRLFRGGQDLEELRRESQEAKNFLVRVQTSHAARVAGEARKEKLAAARGERPSTEKQEEELGAVESKLNGYALKAFLDIEEAVKELEALAFQGQANKARWGADLSSAVSKLSGRAGWLRDLLKESPEDSREFREAQERLREAQEAQAAWDRVEQQLSEPVEGASEAQLTLATREAEQASEALLVAELSQGYQRLVAEKEEAVRLRERLEAAAKDYRVAAQETWKHLGAVVTKELSLPWLQVDGLEIFIGYDKGGKLNSDKEVVRRAERIARAKMRRLTTVPPSRFLLGRIREESPIEWRRLDDQKRVSTAELHEACLEVALSRRDRLGPYLWIDWQVMAAFDEASLIEFDRKVSEAGMYIFSERPRRKGDPLELCLEKVGAQSS